jgi:polysaccharide biosynthesis/export protein
MSFSWMPSKLLLSMAAVGLLAGGTAAIAEQYRLGIGDVLELSVSGAAGLTHRSTIGMDGTIGFPLVGDLQASGMTLAEVRGTLAENLSKMAVRLRHDGVELETVVVAEEVGLSIVEYRPVYLSGDVSQPGQQVFRPGMTVRQAVSLAGGYDIMGFRALNPHFEIAELEGDYQALWFEYASERATLARLEAELAGEDDFSLELELGSPLASEVVLGITAAERERLRLRQADLRKAQESLQASVAMADRRLALLAEKQEREEAQRLADEADLEMSLEMLGKGIGNNTRVNDARRAMMMSSVWALQTSAESARLEREREELHHEAGRLTEARRLETLEALRDTRIRADSVRNRLGSTTEKLALGDLRSQLVRGGRSAPSIRIVRQDEGGAISLAADEDMLLQPGDVIEVTAQFSPSVRSR